MTIPTFKMLGSKARMAKWILESVPDRNYDQWQSYSRWIEPFAGRGNVYFRMIHDNLVSYDQALLNDRYIIKFIEALRDRPQGDFLSLMSVEWAERLAWVMKHANLVGHRAVTQALILLVVKIVIVDLALLRACNPHII